jgi:hypothetical protein
MRGRVCVVGAGSSGLAATKNLLAAGFAVDTYERAGEVGGNWNFGGPTSRVYASTHTISSKPFTQFPDFPMRDDLPDYPHHSQLLDYFRAYARHFELLSHISFGHEVVRASPVDGGWEVTATGPAGAGVSRRYDAVVAANGHNWSPKRPEHPGEFTGELLHSADYKGPDVLAGKRVLVVGAGNTGCDIAVEAAQHAERTFHSTRRGYWYVPKYVGGRPGDQVADLFLALRLPLRFRQWLMAATLRATVGDLTRLGLPRPDHKPLETHPIVNSHLVYFVGHGDITPKPDVARLDGSSVVFADGSREEVDLVVYATGYLVRFDFLDPALLNWRDGRPHLYQHLFTPRCDSLFVAGLLQPDSGQFTLAHWQTVAIAEFLRARAERPAVARDFLVRAAAHLDDSWSAGARYADSTRHWYEIAHLHYLRGLERTIAELRSGAAA